MTVFFLKWKGDLYRYIAEYSDDTDALAAANAAEATYTEAFGIANVNLPPSDPTRMSLVLNASVFKHEITKETDLAAEMLSEAVAEADANAAELSHESARELQDILQMMRHNLQVWAEDSE
jgi:hypothetical protein